MKAVDRKWPVSVGAAVAVVAAIAPTPASTLLLVVALPALWLTATLLVRTDWPALSEAHRMVHLSVGGLVLTAVVSVVGSQILEPDRVMPQQAFLILAGPAALFLVHGLFLVLRDDHRGLTSAELLDALVYLLLPLSLIATLVWPRLSATPATGVRTTMMVLGVLSSVVFLLGLLLVISRPVRSIGRACFVGAVFVLAGTGWLALIGWAREIDTGLVFPQVLTVPPALYLLAVGIDGFGSEPDRRLGGHREARRSSGYGRWLTYGAVGLSIVFLTTLTSAATPIAFAVLCGGLTVARLAVTSAQARRLEHLAEEFDSLITDLSSAPSKQVVFERSSAAAAELLGRRVVVEEVPSSTSVPPQAMAGSGAVVFSRHGRVRIGTTAVIPAGGLPILTDLANLVELVIGPGLGDGTGMDESAVESFDEVDPQEGTTTGPTGGLRASAQVVVEHGIVVEATPSAPAVLGYDPINTDAGPILDAARSAGGIDGAGASHRRLSARVVDGHPSGPMTIDIGEAGAADPLPRIDAGSGLPNQHDFELQGELDNVALIVFYLHDLERVSDAVGSDAGASFVRRIAARVERSFRHHSDRLWRGDGAKLIVVTPLDRRGGSDTGDGLGTSVDVAAVDHGAWIENRRASLSTPTALGMSFIAPAVSVGFTVIRRPTAATEALQQAEMALMFARENSPRSTVEYTTELHARMARNWQIESSLAAGLDDLPAAGLCVHYQPLIEASTGLVKGVEALSRWDHPELGSVSPGEFIPIAEKSGVVAAIDDFVLRQAMADLDRLRSVDDDMGIQVNMSPTGLEPGRLADVAKTILRSLGSEARRFTVEITESALGQQPVDELAEAFAFLREADIGISLDDFGTGESNFERLSHLPFTQVKLANDFVRANDELLVANVVEVVHRLDMDCVIEGVETESQRLVAIRGGGDLLQGWAFLPAVPLDDVIHYCQEVQEAVASSGSSNPNDPSNPNGPIDPIDRFVVEPGRDQSPSDSATEEALPLGLHGAGRERDHDEAD